MHGCRLIPCVLSTMLASACGGGDDGGAQDGPDPETTAGSTNATTDDASTTDTPTSMTGAESPETTVDTSAGDPSGDPSSSGATDPSGDTDPGPLGLPPVDGGLDYQLGGAYPPPEGVAIVSRDRNAAPEAGLYNVCYVNGFQAQPDEADWWLTEHPDLVLRDGNGDPVIDPDWDEMLLDTSTAEKRTALGEIVADWIAGCDAAGFDAIEIDNLDSYARSQGLLDQDGNVATMALYSAAAHAGGMASAQKNSTELLARRDEMGTDFAVAEECSTYDECGDYVDAYGDGVLMIEYVRADFEQGCAEWPGHSIVLRDVELVTPDAGGYVYDAC